MKAAVEIDGLTLQAFWHNTGADNTVYIARKMKNLI